MKKIVTVTILLALIFILGLPWGLYWFGLSNLATFPIAPQQTTLSNSERIKIWNDLKETGDIQIRQQTPYDYFFPLNWGNNPKQTTGKMVAWYVARNIKTDSLKDKRMFSWRLTTTALTIWLTRNWSAEQLLAKAKEITLLQEIHRTSIAPERASQGVN